jgi:hypothetical protein
VSESTSSTPNSTPSSTQEAAADLSQNLDEAADLQLGLGALGGLRHSRACEDAERSKRRYDARNHRLHESRMKRLGLEGEESPEDEAMDQQVLIRSPVTHHYHYAQPSAAPPSASSQPQEGNTAKPKSTASTLAKAAMVAAGLVAGGGLGAGIPWLAGAFDKPAAVNTTIQQPAQNLGVGVEVVPGGATEARQ